MNIDMKSQSEKQRVCEMAEAMERKTPESCPSRESDCEAQARSKVQMPNVIASEQRRRPRKKLISSFGCDSIEGAVNPLH